MQTYCITVEHIHKKQRIQNCLIHCGCCSLSVSLYLKFCRKSPFLTCVAAADCSSCNRQKCVDDFICRKMWHRNLIMSLYLAVPRRQRGNILWGRNNGLWHRDIGLTSSHIHLDRLSCHHHGTISWYWIGMDGTMGQLAHFLRLYFHNSGKSYIGCSKYFLRFS